MKKEEILKLHELSEEEQCDWLYANGILSDSIGEGFMYQVISCILPNDGRRE